MPASSLYCCQRSASMISAAARNRRIAVSPRVSLPLASAAGGSANSRPTAVVPTPSVAPFTTNERRLITSWESWLFSVILSMGLVLSMAGNSVDAARQTHSCRRPAGESLAYYQRSRRTADTAPWPSAQMDGIGLALPVRVGSSGRLSRAEGYGATVAPERCWPDEMHRASEVGTMAETPQEKPPSVHREGRRPPKLVLVDPVEHDRRARGP